MTGRTLLRGVAGTLFPVATAASVAVVVARLAGEPIGWVALIPAMGLLVAGMVAAAALAAGALSRRRWRWAAALVVLWPIAIPLYLWARRSSVSGEPEV